MVPRPSIRWSSPGLRHFRQAFSFPLRFRRGGLSGRFFHASERREGSYGPASYVGVPARRVRRPRLDGGLGSNFASARGRLDMDAIAYWELRNLGAGDRAARRGAQSTVRQAQVSQLATMDLIAREVTEAQAQVEALQAQIETAEKGVRLAASSFQRNLDRIEAAKGLPIEALQSAQSLAAARRDYLRVVVQYNSAQFTLHRALGWPVDPRIAQEIQAGQEQGAHGERHDASEPIGRPPGAANDE